MLYRYNKKKEQFPKCWRNAHTFFLIKPRRTIKTQPKDVKQCTQTTQKLKRGSPVFKLRNNFEKNLEKKTKKTNSKTHQTHTTDTALPEHTSKGKNKRSKGMKTHWKAHFSNVTFPCIWNYVNYAIFEDSLL